MENRSGESESSLTPVSVIRATLVKPMAYASSGMEFVAAVGIFAFGGLWIDRRFDLLPLFTLVGFVIGLSLGFLSLYRTVYRLGLQDEREAAAAGPRPPRAPMKGSSLESLDGSNGVKDRRPFLRRGDEE